MAAKDTNTGQADFTDSTQNKLHVLADCLKPAAITLHAAITGTTAVVGAVTEDFIDIQADTLCFVEFGPATPTAALNTSYPIQPGVVYRFPFVSGDEVAVIGTAGNVWVSPVGK